MQLEIIRFGHGALQLGGQVSIINHLNCCDLEGCARRYMFNVHPLNALKKAKKKMNFLE